MSPSKDLSESGSTKDQLFYQICLQHSRPNEIQLNNALNSVQINKSGSGYESSHHNPKLKILPSTVSLRLVLSVYDVAGLVPIHHNKPSNSPHLPASGPRQPDSNVSTRLVGVLFGGTGGFRLWQEFTCRHRTPSLRACRKNHCSSRCCR